MTDEESQQLHRLLELLNAEGETESDKFRDFLRKLPDYLIEKKPSEIVDSETTETDNSNFFDCQKLCRNYPKCRENMNTSINMKNEIDIANCYTSKFPYDWTTPDGRTVRVCKFMIFKRGVPYDLDNPYPKCIAKPKDRFVDIPKDHVITDPQICWTCVKLRKKAREQKIVDRAIKGSFKRAKIDWGNSGGDPDLWRLGDQ